MIFLLVFGKNVRRRVRPCQVPAFYFAGGFVATVTQTAMTLIFGSAADAGPNLGASGAIAAVSAPISCSNPTRMCVGSS